MSRMSGVITWLSTKTIKHNRRRALCRRALSWIVTGSAITVWLWFSINLWEGLTGFCTVRELQDDPTPGLIHNGTNVLILSSSGRSGSSLLADIVASFDDSFYYFEPMLVVNPDGNTREETIEELRRVFRCELRDNLFSDYIGRGTVRYSNKKNCQTGIHLGYKIKRARYKCRTYPWMIVKTIRTRLEWLPGLMEDSELNLKVIHLVRDPRPIRMSQKRLTFTKGYTAAACDNILKDAQFKEQMERKYSSRYMFIRYEDFVVNMLNKTADIYKFVNGAPRNNASYDMSSDDLPQCCKRYIALHTSNNKGGDYSTYRKTSQVIQHWRSVITQKELSETEDICRETLVFLGYNLFTTVNAARNKSIPVLVKDNLQNENAKKQDVIL